MQLDDINEGIVSPRARVLVRDIRRGLFIVFVLLGGLFLWMGMVPIASSVIGEGVVRVEMSRQVIQATTTGRVQEILTEDGQSVVEGETLVRLHDAKVSASSIIFRSALDSELAKQARLEAEQRDLPNIEFPSSLNSRKSEAGVKQFCQREVSLFVTRRKNLGDQLQLLDLQRREATAELERFDRQRAAQLAALQIVRAQVVDQRKLYADKYIAKTRLQDNERIEQEYEAKVHEIEGESIRTRQKINDFELRAVGLKSNYMQLAAEELKESGRKIADLQEQLASSLDAKKSMDLLAPMAGKVFNLKTHTVGELVQAGSVIAEIVPNQSERIIEALIPVREIKHVSIGSRARVKFTAYNQRTTPDIDGVVTFLSPDRASDKPEVLPSYLVRIRLDQESLKKAGELDIIPGMSATVFIVAEDRTMLTYLVQPFVDVVSKSFRETY